MTATADLYTETEVAELLTVAVLKARARDREELAGLRAALRVAELGGLSAAVVRKAMTKGFDPNEKRDEGGKWTNGGEQADSDDEPETDEPFDHDEYEGSQSIEHEVNSDLDASTAKDFAPHDAGEAVAKEHAKHLEDKDHYAATVAEFIEDADDRKAFKAEYQGKRKELERAGIGRQIAMSQASSINEAIERTERELDDAKEADLEQVYPDLYPDPPTKRSEVAQYKAGRQAAHKAAREKYREEKLKPLAKQKREYEAIGAKKFAVLEQATDSYVATADGLAEWIRSGGKVQKALSPDPPPDDDSDPDDTDVSDSPEAELLSIAIDLAEEGHVTGDDVQGGLDALYELLDDPDELERVAGGTFEKAWDESKHPRGKNGHFISRDAIADAKSDPEKAKKLREEVKPADKQKLEDALSGKTDLGTTAKRQKRDLTADKRQKKQADRRTAMDLVYKIRDAHASGKAVAADDLHALIPHLSTLTGEELRDVRTQLFRLGATFNGERRVSERAKNLTDWARKQALDARMKEQGFGDEEAAAAKQVVGAAKPVAPEPVAAPEPAKPAEPQPAAQPQPATAPQAAQAQSASVPGHDTWRNKLPAAVAAKPKTQKARDELARGVKNAWVEARNVLAQKYGSREINDRMTPEEKKHESDLHGTLEALATGNERDGTMDLGPVSDARYAGYYRAAVQAIDGLRGSAAQPATAPKAASKPAHDPKATAPLAAAALAKKPLADKQHLEKVAAAAPDQTTREYLKNAAHNVPGDRQTLHPADRRHQTVERLAAEHRNALAAGHTGAAGHLAKVIGEYGGKLEGAAPGETVPFDGSLYDSAERPGEGTLWTGQPARVIRQPILGPDGRVAVRGEMEPAGTAAPQPRTPRGTGRADDAAPTEDEIAAASRPHVPKPSVPATPVAATATGGNNPPVPPTGGGSRVGSGGMDDPMHKMTLAQLRSSGRPLFDPAKAGAFPARVGYIGRIKIGDHGAYVDYNFPNATNKAEATALAVDKARAELTPEQAHRLAVRQAFSNGHTVPSEVLADYPEIQPMGEYIDPLDRPIDPVARARRAAEDAAAAARWREIDKRHDA